MSNTVTKIIHKLEPALVINTGLRFIAVHEVNNALHLNKAAVFKNSDRVTNQEFVQEGFNF
jgi:hypothetical protein